MRTRKIAWLAAGILLTGMVACNNDGDTDGTNDDSANQTSAPTQNASPSASYVDLNSGKTVDVWYDTDKGYTADRTTGNRVDLYVNTVTNDTLYGFGDDAVIVNHAVIMGDDGKWKLDEAKIERDGNKIKIKTPDGDKLKVKTDEDGGTKVKANDEKVKNKPDNK